MESLGINGLQLVAQIINVAILFFILQKFVYKPLLKMLDARKQEIDKGLKLSNEMQARELEMEESKAKIIKLAREEAVSVRREMLNETKKESADILKGAELEAKKIREKAKAAYDNEIKRLKTERDEEIVKKATELANKALQDLLTKETRIKLTEKQLREL